MEGSQISSRNSGWKNSIIKEGGKQSRIMESSRVDREFPAKFSPSKNIEVNPKLFARSNILSRSDDSFRIDKDRSLSKEGSKLIKGLASTPKAESPSFKLALNLNSEKEFEQTSLSPRKNPQFANNTANSVEYLQEIKLEYLRFKDKVMKDLKKLQKQIRNAIEEVMNVVEINSSHFAANKLQRTSSVAAKLTPNPAFSSEVKISSNIPKLNFPQSNPPSIDTSKYREVLTGSTTIESVLPKIKEKMGKFFDLMGQMKTQINSQVLYSPVATKSGDLGPI